ncbi:DUF4871 domain-containing protein [Parageobacillus sp. KH3-4]|uniref:DUF4871 domain-containing protein n=1 Tax=Parageobacillus sp. KH3-4 TaxID=2916802 RepID=UPI001FCB8E99|nr:DUF4871 domain-containing protein [Parageobacillus sp. KH3-4]
MRRATFIEGHFMFAGGMLMKFFILLILATMLVACSKDTNIPKNVTQSESQSDDVPSFFNLSVIKNVDWKESEVFTYEGLELRGIPGKVGILSTPWKAGVNNKYMWHFFGDNIPSGKLTVIAVQEGTNKVSKALTDDRGSHMWVSPYGSVPKAVNGHTDIPANMMLPNKGKWVLNAYIGKELFGQIVVDVQ